MQHYRHKQDTVVKFWTTCWVASAMSYSMVLDPGPVSSHQCPGGELSRARWGEEIIIAARNTDTATHHIIITIITSQLVKYRFWQTQNTKILKFLMVNRLSSAPFTSENHDDMMHLPADESRWSGSDGCVKVCQERINIRWSLPIMRHTVLIHPDIDHQHHRYEEDESFLILIK